MSSACHSILSTSCEADVAFPHTHNMHNLPSCVLTCSELADTVVAAQITARAALCLSTQQCCESRQPLLSRLRQRPLCSFSRRSPNSPAHLRPVHTLCSPALHRPPPQYQHQHLHLQTFPHTYSHKHRFPTQPKPLQSHRSPPHPYLARHAAPSHKMALIQHPALALPASPRARCQNKA